MKKLLFLSLILSAIISTTGYAQAGDPVSMLQQVKDRVKAPMVEKTGLSEAQVDKIIEINFEFRQQLGDAIKGLNETDRAAKIAELKAAKEKKISEIPLTAGQIESVNNFYKEMGKNMPQRTTN
jgi:TRAP-type uncharacterized transport system substrate-binding protein